MSHRPDSSGHSLPNLTGLSLSGGSRMQRDGVGPAANQWPIYYLGLDLSSVPRVTDAFLEAIAYEYKQLQELKLDGCVDITDIGIGYVSTMRSLCALFLRGCSQLSDVGLQHLCGMRSLSHLSVAGCPLLTSSGLSSLIQLRRLQKLELTDCPGTSRELFDYLRKHLPRCLIIE